jgi:hypothetical protein
MNQEKFNRIVDDLNEYTGVKEVFLLNSGGETIHKYGNIPLSIEEGKELLMAWKEKKPSLTYKNNRFAILKNDDIQLAAKNIANQQGNIAGSITREGDFLIAHIDPETNIILLEWSILVNKMAWS